MTETKIFLRPPLPDLCMSQLNALRLLLIMVLGFGYASTMSRGPEYSEWGNHMGTDPSWFAIQVLFFISGIMAMRSLTAGRRGWTYLRSRALRNLPWLALYTGAVTILLFPLLCSPEARNLQAVPRLAQYFFETVLLIRPGQTLPGLLDNAAYMCLAQGAIWTLRIGAILHIGAALIGLSRYFRDKYVILALAVISAVTYGVILFFAAKTNTISLETYLPVFRLGYAFAAGMAIFAWRESLPKRGIIHGAIMGGLLSFALLNHYAWAWTPAIEICMTGFWAYAAFLVLEKPFPALQNWPNLVAPMFFGVWPIAQVYLKIAPTISTTALIGAVLLTSLTLAYLLHQAATTFRSRKFQRDKSAFNPPDFSQA